MSACCDFTNAVEPESRIVMTAIEIGKALNAAEPLFEPLQTHYRDLPETICDCRQPGICCSLIPETTLIEAFQWLAVIRQHSHPEELLRRFAAHFLTNPVRRNGCPFLDKGRCTNYPQRSFACRAYGLWSHRTGAERTAESKAAKRQLAAQWARMGIHIAEQSIAWEPDYCTGVTACTDRPPTDQRLLAILGKIYALDGRLPELKSWYEQSCHSDFSFFIACLLWGQRKATLAKLTVIRELTSLSCQDKLERLLGQVTAAAAAAVLGL
jgi:Fe-S-cluster containining protein